MTVWSDGKRRRRLLVVPGKCLDAKKQLTTRDPRQPLTIHESETLAFRPFIQPTLVFLAAVSLLPLHRRHHDFPRGTRLRQSVQTPISPSSMAFRGLYRSGAVGCPPAWTLMLSQLAASCEHGVGKGPHGSIQESRPVS